MRAHIITNGVVTNTVEVDALSAGMIDGAVGGIGWLWNGSVLSAPAAVVLVPQIISPRQLRQALTHFGYRADIESTIAAADQDTKDWYAYATQFERSHPKVAAVASGRGYTSAQIDAVWTYGASV